MGRDAGLGLMVLLVACGVAYGAQGKPTGGRDRWDAVEGLPVNALIEVLPWISRVRICVEFRRSMIVR
jgi:hypothetical protein